MNLGVVFKAGCALGMCLQAGRHAWMMSAHPQHGINLLQKGYQLQLPPV